jgi:aminobenzoyl-glutamate transport protein
MPNRSDAMTAQTETPQAGGLLRWIERVGNKLPHPFWMFVWITLAIVVFSAVAAVIGISAVDPGSGEVVRAQNLVSGEGLRRLLEEMVTNFAHFAPFGMVLVMLMGVSVAEQSGLLTIILRTVAFAVPRKVVLPVIFVIGACGNIGSDAGVVIVPPIAALIFSKMGLHPIAGLVAGYAGATAGFTANLFIAGTDVLLAGISTEVAAQIDPDIEVSATANWYFMIVSTLMLGLGGAFVASRFTIPRCAGFAMADDAEQAYEEAPRMTAQERKGVRWAGVSVLLFLLAVAALTVPAGAPLRNQDTGGLVPSPFLRGLVPLLFFLFALPGYVYGKITGSIEKPDDVLKFMEKGMKDLAGYIVLMLVIAQFINLFSWSRLDSILAINGAEFLQSTGLTGPLMFILFMILVALINIFMGSGSAKWAIFAPVFIPMLAQLNYSPAFIQLMYRVGDSITNCISPLYVYFPLLMGWVRHHDRSLGIGTILSLLVPYAALLFLLWTALVFVWFWLELPIGVGEGILLAS